MKWVVLVVAAGTCPDCTVTSAGLPPPPPNKPCPPKPQQHQGRAANPALLPHEYESLFLEHTQGLADALIAACKEALAPLLTPLLPPALAAAGEAARAAAKASVGDKGGATGGAGGGGLPPPPPWPGVDARTLPEALRSYAAAVGAAPAAAALEGDARWGRTSEELRCGRLAYIHVSTAALVAQRTQHLKQDH